jgi:hypothetical protein
MQRPGAHSVNWPQSSQHRPTGKEAGNRAPPKELSPRREDDSRVCRENSLKGGQAIPLQLSKDKTLLDKWLTPPMPHITAASWEDHN